MLQDADVLVVGAGPVGLLAALSIGARGATVTVVDEETRVAGHSYACALHGDSLKLLNEFGLANEPIRKGRSLHSIAFYEGRVRKAEAHFTDLPGEFPFVEVLPQSALEDMLERQLLSQLGLRIEWNHRLANLRSHHDGVVATVEKLADPQAGYILPNGARPVCDRVERKYRFVIGADGAESFVRRHLHIGFPSFGDGQAFIVYEFATDADLPHEVRAVFEGATANVMWPLADRRCRWSFQVSPDEVLGETKVRRPLAAKFEDMEAALKQHARMLLEQRAPWFKGRIEEIEWWTGAHFQPRLATLFGRGRCWLAGDAAHRTSPIGVQSLNIGLREAAALGAAINTVLKSGGAERLLEQYGYNSRLEWTKLLSATLDSSIPARGWVYKNRRRIVPCLPASGSDLDLLFEQLEFRSRLGFNAEALVST